MLQNKMKRLFVIFGSILACLNIFGQEDYVLETRFRNPVDTTKFHTNPTLLLFVHSQCHHEHQCATTRMQKALEEDSLQIRKERGIKLYVVYPTYKKEDIKMFDSYNPVLSEVVFYTDTKYKGIFSEGNLTPFAILYDGKGNVFTRLGGTYEDLCEWMKTKVFSRICCVWGGSGIYVSNHPDFWKDKRHGKPCTGCYGTGRIRIKY